MTEQYARHSQIFDPKEMALPITVVGCGSLGSYIALGLAKLGFVDFDLYDHDTVELHNVPNQAFGVNQIGESKSKALSYLIDNQFGTSELQAAIYDELGLYNGQTIKEGILINAADSITVRKTAYETAPENTFIVDVRSNGESFNVFFCDKSKKKDREYYERFFFEPSASAGANCNAQSVVYNSMLIASIALSGIVRYSRMEEYPSMVDGNLATFDVCPVFLGKKKEEPTEL